jgi:hypothetical protein
MNRPIPMPGGPPVASPFIQSPFMNTNTNANNNNNNIGLGPPPPLAPRRPPTNAPPPPPSRQQQQQQAVGMATASPLARSLPPAPGGASFDSSPGGAYVDASAWTVSNSNANANAPGAFGRARARSRSVGSLARPNPSLFASSAPPTSNTGPGGPPPSFNNAGGSMRMPPSSSAAAPAAKPLKPPKTSKLPVGATSGDAFGTVSPPPGAGGTFGGPIGARSDSAFGVVQPIQPGGSMRLPPTQQMGGSFRDMPVGGSLGPRHTSQPNFAVSSQPSAVVRGQISPRGAPPPQQQQQPPSATGQLVSGTDQPVERCVCPKCGKLFYFRSDVETHMRLRHT